MRLSIHLLGPPGWLDSFGAGTLLAARAAGGFLSLEPVDVSDLAAPPVDLAERLGELLDLANEGDGMPVPAEELQVLGAVDHGWFASPYPPFSDLAEAAGFEMDGDLVGRPGCWEEHQRLADVIVAITRQDLSETETSLLLAALKGYDAWREGSTTDPSRGLRERLRHNWTVALPLVEELRRRGVGPDDLGDFADALGGGVGEWLASRAAALKGDGEAAERLANAAVAADPGFGPAVSEAAWYAADRGRARDAANLLHRVRHHDDPELQALRRFDAASAMTAGRNEPCPCGSGRKFKQCHLGRPTLPEGDRVRWLLDKASQFVSELADPELLDDVTVAGEEGGSILGVDLLVFDGGFLERFLAARGPLLPDIERQWAGQWTTSHVASVFRLDERLADGRVVLEDARTGARHTVEPGSALDDLSTGRLLWTRLLPVDDRWWTIGLVRHTNLSERATLLAATAPGTPIATRLEALVPEPTERTLQNTSGDPTVLCTTVVKLDDASAAADLLDEELERYDAEFVWHAHDDTDALADAVTATFRMGDEGELRVETNSIERRDAALELLAERLPGVEVVHEDRVPVARAQAARFAGDLVATALRSLRIATVDGDAEDGDGGESRWNDVRVVDPLDDEDDLDDDDDEDDFPGDDSEKLEAAMTLIRDTFEERWLDTPMPVLGGRTPREAVDDDAYRPDLVTLVAELADDGSLFDADRPLASSRLGLPSP